MADQRVAPSAPVNRLRSLNHVLDILEALHAHGPDVGVTDLAREVGMTKSSVHEILANLEARSYVARCGSGRYALGIKLAELGFAVERERGITDAAAPYLKRLATLAGESTHLSVYDIGEVVYLNKVTTPHAVQAYTTIGGRAPAHCVATGKAQLAFQEPGLIEPLLATLERYTAATITDADEMRRELATIRFQGFAVNAGEWRADVVGVAAPIYDFSGATVAAIGISGPLFRFTLETAREYGPEVAGIAAEVSGLLGYQQLPRSPSLASTTRS